MAPRSTPKDETPAEAGTDITADTGGRPDLGAAEVQQRVEQEQAQGYVGAKVDPLPNSAHSLASGPDAPPIVADSTSRAAVPNAADVNAETSTDTTAGDTEEK